MPIIGVVEPCEALLKRFSFDIKPSYMMAHAVYFREDIGDNKNNVRRVIMYNDGSIEFSTKYNSRLDLIRYNSNSGEIFLCTSRARGFGFGFDSKDHRNFKMFSTEEEYFQESLINDYTLCTFSDMQRIIQLYEFYNQKAQEKWKSIKSNHVATSS